MGWTIHYYSAAVEKLILNLPDGLLARYVRLATVMLEFGPNLGMPHTRAMGSGLFELRLTAKEGIARVFCCTTIRQRIVVLHGFIKKSEQTPLRELRVARMRLLKVRQS
jgi:phage-related protein